MRTTPKPIQTRYAGCHFRSRLEARYAVFFDRLGIQWEYEPEGYATPDGWYLPDFLLHLHRPVLFEVKPLSEIGQKDDRWWGASRAAGARLIAAYGLPQHPDLPPGEQSPIGGRAADPLVNGHYNLFDGTGELDSWDNCYAFCACPWCGSIGIEFDGRGARVCGYERHGLTFQQAEQQVGHYDKAYSYNHPAIVYAYTAARSARFEHGQRG